MSNENQIGVVQQSLCDAKIVHLHPTLRCNLSCQHCYSNSAPHLKDVLPMQQVLDFLDIAREVGYNVLSVSGGEPFLYRDLDQVFVHSKSLGFENNLATNGMLLQSDFAARVLAHTDVIAVSVDGPPALHDRIRGLAGSFDKTLQGLETLRKMGKGFGIIHTVTAQSWEELIWLAEFAVAQGAGLLQLHPLELYGRARTLLPELALDQETMHKVFILTEYLRSKHGADLFVQLDLLHRDYIADAPAMVSVFDAEQEISRLADLQNVLIVTERGDIVPTVYGFAEFFNVGNIAEGKTALRDKLERYLAEKGPSLRQVFAATREAILNDADNEIVNWNAIVADMSHRMYGAAVIA